VRVDALGWSVEARSPVALARQLESLLHTSQARAPELSQVMLASLVGRHDERL